MRRQVGVCCLWSVIAGKSPAGFIWHNFVIQTVKLSYHTRKEQEKKSSMFDGFLKSSKQIDVESERVIKSF